MTEEKKYLEIRIVNIKSKRQSVEFTFAKQEQEYNTKTAMLDDEIYECEKRLEELSRSKDKEDV